MPLQKIAGSWSSRSASRWGSPPSTGTLPSTAFVAAGLILIFFGPEQVNDERVQQLKMKAHFVAMSAGFGLTMAANMALTVAATPRPRVHDALSAYDFLAGMLMLSLILFHSWRWQDSRAVAP